VLAHHITEEIIATAAARTCCTPVTPLPPPLQLSVVLINRKIINTLRR